MEAKILEPLSVDNMDRWTMDEVMVCVEQQGCFGQEFLAILRLVGWLVGWLLGDSIDLIWGAALSGRRGWMELRC